MGTTIQDWREATFVAGQQYDLIYFKEPGDPRLKDVLGIMWNNRGRGYVLNSVEPSFGISNPEGRIPITVRVTMTATKPGAQLWTPKLWVGDEETWTVYTLTHAIYIRDVGPDQLARMVTEQNKSMYPHGVDAGIVDAGVQAIQEAAEWVGAVAEDVGGAVADSVSAVARAPSKIFSTEGLIVIATILTAGAVGYALLRAKLA